MTARRLHLGTRKWMLMTYDEIKVYILRI